MTDHSFIFKPGTWQGTGKITFSMAPDELPFSTSWQVTAKENEIIPITQVVIVEQFNEPLNNHFRISHITPTNFTIELENHLVGRVKGSGVLSDKIIAWEFRAAEEGFEGYEIYELKEDNTYAMKAEFLGGEGFRTIVTGTIKKI